MYLLDFDQFLTRINFVHGAFEDFLSGTKFCKIKTNDPHLLSFGDDKTICLNKQLFY